MRKKVPKIILFLVYISVYCFMFYYTYQYIQRKQFKTIQSAYAYECNLVGIRKKSKSGKSNFFALLLFNLTPLNMHNIPAWNIKSLSWHSVFFSQFLRNRMSSTSLINNL